MLMMKWMSLLWVNVRFTFGGILYFIYYYYY